MGESSSENSNLEKPNLVAEALHNFTSYFPKHFEQFGFKPLKNKNNFRSPELSATEHKESSSSSSISTTSLSLEKQMEAWKHNPEWVDHPPIIKVTKHRPFFREIESFFITIRFNVHDVTIPKGSLSYLSLNVDVGLPPDAVYDIVTDPDNKRVFKNIKEVVSRKVLVDEGLRQVVEVEQAAIWRFLWWSGTISVHVLVDQNRENHTMKFKQMKSGFMERFEGSWRMEPLFVDEELCHPLKPKSVREYVACSNGRGRIGSRLKLEQLIQPAIVPPPPISWYLRGITTKTTEMLITDLLAEAARIRRASSTTADSGEKSSETEEGYLCKIKERWALRRKNARHSHRRLSHNSKFS